MSVIVNNLVEIRKAFELETKERIEPETYSKRDLESKREYAKIKGLESFFVLRKNWSWKIFGFITSILTFQFIIILLLGLDWINLDKYKWLLSLIIGENFLHIIGMGYIIIKFLYNNNEDK